MRLKFALLGGGVSKYYFFLCLGASQNQMSEFSGG